MHCHPHSASSFIPFLVPLWPTEPSSSLHLSFSPFHRPFLSYWYPHFYHHAFSPTSLVNFALVHFCHRRNFQHPSTSPCLHSCYLLHLCTDTRTSHYPLFPLLFFLHSFIPFSTCSTFRISTFFFLPLSLMHRFPHSDISSNIFNPFPCFPLFLNSFRPTWSSLPPSLLHALAHSSTSLISSLPYLLPHLIPL